MLHAQQAFRQQELAISSAEASARALDRALQLSERLCAASPIATLFHSDPEVFNLFRWFLDLAPVDAQRIRSEALPCVLDSPAELAELMEHLSLWSSPLPQPRAVAVAPAALRVAPPPVTIPVPPITESRPRRAPTQPRARPTTRRVTRRSALIDDEAEESSGEGEGDAESGGDSDGEEMGAEDIGQSEGAGDDDDDDEDEGEGDESLPSSPPARTTGRLKRTNSSAFTPPRGAVPSRGVKKPKY